MPLDGENHFCFKPGHTFDLFKRESNYFIGNPNNNILCYIKIPIGVKQIENCIKNITKYHKIKNSEILCNISLEQIIEIICNCFHIVKKHFCTCNICNKDFKLEYLDKHLCYSRKNLEVIFQDEDNLKKFCINQSKYNCRLGKRSRSRSRLKSKSRSRLKSKSRPQTIPRIKSGSK